MSEAVVALLLFVAALGLAHRVAVDSRLVMAAGGGAMVLIGWGMGFYPPRLAVAAIHFDTLALIFGMSMISSTLTRSGYFTALALRIAGAVRAQGGWAILVLCSLATYAVSLVVNNLAAMLVVLPVTLSWCRAMRVDPVPVVVAQLIASNLGGASSMVGDFPNMIISGVAHLHFLDFIGGVMAPCLVLLAVLLVWFRYHQPTGESWVREGLGSGERSAWREELQTVLAPQGGGGGCRVDERLYRLGMTTLLLCLAGFLLADWWSIRPAWVAFAGGMTLVMLARDDPSARFEAMGGGEILFFAGLFVMVGGLQSAGVLDGVGRLIAWLGGESGEGRLVALMWIAGLLTPFLNAGPATAFFIPIALEMSAATPGPAVWWALSLGVLAGSSASLTGATAGAVTMGQVERYLRKHPDYARSLVASRGLTFREYWRWGVPIWALFLLLSTPYVWVIGSS